VQPASTAKLSHKKRKTEAEEGELGAAVGGGGGAASAGAASAGKKRGRKDKEGKPDKMPNKGARDSSSGTVEGCAKSHKKKKVEVDVRGEEGDGGVDGERVADSAPSPFRKMTEGQRRLQEAMLAQFTKPKS
jgi:hypothetical protein